ncbi:MAG: 4a-hydroxytetrahydrobiopterin dehydratase [Pyrinomonadaceae bacterium]
MERRILRADELHAAIRMLDGWAVDGKFLKKRYEFADFAASLGFVNRVGALAEAADHHPDITFGWGYAEIALTTHDRGGITDVDVSLARRISEVG